MKKGRVGTCLWFLILLLLIQFSSLFTPFLASAANVSIIGLSVSNTSPAAGSVLGVTVTYCDSAGQTPYWLVALSHLGGTLQACPSSPTTPIQVFVVDSNTTPAGVSPVNGVQSDVSPSNGWEGITVPAVPPSCPYTQVFNVTLPALCPTGTGFLIVAAGDSSVQCSSNINSTDFVQLNFPNTVPTFGVAQSVETSTAAPGGLVLFDLNYYFANSFNCIVEDNVPANLTYLAASGSPGGTTYSGGLVTWNIGTVTNPVQGTLWVLASVNTGTPQGTNVGSAGGLSSATGVVSFFNPVTVTVQIPQLMLLKSESATILSAGNAVSYVLDWTATGQNLQLFDSYDNIPAGTLISDISSPTTVGWGFDGTGYITGAGPVTSEYGEWTIGTDSQGPGRHFISARTSHVHCAGGVGEYPVLIRNVPGFDICGDVVVEGDLEIPTTNTCTTADAEMVIACNPSQGITFKAGISLDNSPNNLFIQVNNIYPFPPGLGMAVGPVSFSVQTGLWYTMRSEIQTAGSGSTTILVSLWPLGLPAQAVTLIYVDSLALLQPTCSGGWRAGWQANETASTDWYSNLRIFGPGPVVNASVTDVVPQYVSYVGSNLPDTVSGSSPQTLVWNALSAFPATMFSFNTPVSWWGLVACPGPVTNMFSMGSPSIPSANSNTVTLNVSGGCLTSTPTQIPTLTSIPTITLTPTITFTPTITLTPTITPTPSYLGPNGPDPGTSFVYPSPSTTGIVNFAFYMTEGGTAQVLVWNTSAELVADTSQGLWTGPQKITLSTQGWAKGVYFYRVILRDSSGKTDRLPPDKFLIE